MRVRQPFLCWTENCMRAHPNICTYFPSAHFSAFSVIATLAVLASNIICMSIYLYIWMCFCVGVCVMRTGTRKFDAYQYTHTEQSNPYVCAARTHPLGKIRVPILMAHQGKFTYTLKHPHTHTLVFAHSGCTQSLFNEIKLHASKIGCRSCCLYHQFTYTHTH